MTTIFDALAAEGIHLSGSALGRYYVTCPQCSPGRKAAHKNLRVLGVTVENDHARFGCNHCGWTGAVGKPNGHAARITYDYVDEDGALLFQKVRNHPGREPRFWLRHPDGNGAWEKGRDKAHAGVIYRLPQIRKAIEEGRSIVAVEGEKDADRLWQLGIPATCNPDGAAEPGQKPKWRRGHSKWLPGADLIVTGDNDAAGRAHIDATISASKAIAARVRVLDPKCWHVPPKQPGSKQGKDVSDWLDANRTRERQLLALFEREAIDFLPQQTAASDRTTKPGVDADDADLVHMNHDHAIVRVAGKTRVITFADDGELVFSSVEDFVQFHANRKRRWTDEDGNQKSTSVGRWWINHPYRRQHNGITFAPGVEQNEVNGKLNLWRGFSCEPKPGDCSLYLAHVRDNICAGNTEHFKYLLDVMADTVRNPNKQGEVCVVVRSDEEGTGKGFFVKQFGKLFDPYFFHIGQGAHLTGKFNAHFERCCVLFADECFWAGDKSHEGVLKFIVTEEMIPIERKGIDVIRTPNRIHLFISSNNSWVIPASASARRWFVLDVAPHQMQNIAYFAAIDAQMNNGGREALLHMLSYRDLTKVDIRKVPQTTALARQKAFTRRGVDRLIEILATDGVIPCAHEYYRNTALTSGEGEGKGFYAQAKNLVPDLKHVSSITIATTLVESWGCTRWKSGTRRGIAFPELNELRNKFDERHGAQNWPEGLTWQSGETGAAEYDYRGKY